MKTLKFDHEFADDIRKGLKTTTWRVHDTKDISVNDELELIDKVQPDNPSTWTAIGSARVEKIIEKRLGDIDDDDLRGHRLFASRDEMLATYRQRFSPDVNFDTPVKIIHFKLTQAEDLENSDVSLTPVLTEVKLYTDGGSRGNPGPSACGFVIMDMDDRVVVKKGEYIGITTNNQAEYQALRLGLEEALRMRAREVHVYMDSMLVVNQMLGSFQIKNRDLWPVHAQVMELTKQFKHVSFIQIPRKLNKLADKAVNEALDAAEGQ